MVFQCKNATLRLLFHQKNQGKVEFNDIFISDKFKSSALINGRVSITTMKFYDEIDENIIEFAIEVQTKNINRG